MVILEVEHLKKTYTTRLGSNRVEALRDVNFNVEQGEFVAIMGESGSGKTTLCNLMARFWDVQGGGERQRISIARAIMKDAPVIILDEATSALDVTVQKQIIELLQQLQKERKLAYLFICHNIALVQQFCDRVIVLHDGRIVESGLPDEVILYPQSDYTRRLVDAVF